MSIIAPWIYLPDYKYEYQLKVLSPGLLGTNVSYLKTKKTYQPVMDTEEESAEKVQFLKSSGTSILSVDSLEANGETWGTSREVTATGLQRLGSGGLSCPAAYITSHTDRSYALPRESES
jgi:hypothetical protein